VNRINTRRKKEEKRIRRRKRRLTDKLFENLFGKI